MTADTITARQEAWARFLDLIAKIDDIGLQAELMARVGEYGQAVADDVLARVEQLRQERQ
jgi:hypothetical protein